MNGGWWLASYIVLWVLVLGLTALVVALIRQIGLLHLRIAPTGAFDTGDGPEVGDSAPPVAAVPPGRDALIVFGSDTCRLCVELLPSITALARAHPHLAVVVASASDRFAARVAPPAVGVADVNAVVAWRIRATPFAVLVGA